MSYQNQSLKPENIVDAYVGTYMGSSMVVGSGSRAHRVGRIWKFWSKPLPDLGVLARAGWTAGKQALASVLLRSGARTPPGSPFSLWQPVITGAAVLPEEEEPPFVEH